MSHLTLYIFLQKAWLWSSMKLLFIFYLVLCWVGFSPFLAMFSCFMMLGSFVPFIDLKLSIYGLHLVFNSVFPYHSLLHQTHSWCFVKIHRDTGNYWVSLIIYLPEPSLIYFFESNFSHDLKVSVIRKVEIAVLHFLLVNFLSLCQIPEMRNLQEEGFIFGLWFLIPLKSWPAGSIVLGLRWRKTIMVARKGQRLLPHVGQKAEKRNRKRSASRYTLSKPHTEWFLPQFYYLSIFYLNF